MTFTNHNPRYTKKQKDYVDKAAMLSPDLAYHLSFRTQLKTFEWSDQYKYVIFTTPRFSTKEFIDNDCVPEGYTLGKIVVHAKTRELEVEINFIPEDKGSDHTPEHRAFVSLKKEIDEWVKEHGRDTGALFDQAEMEAHLKGECLRDKS